MRLSGAPQGLLGAGPDFFEDVEPIAGPGWQFDPAVNNTGAASPTWAVTADPSAHSLTNSFSSNASTLDLKDDRLVSPPLNLTSTCQPTFWHRFGTEAGFDGGVLELSSDGGASWVDVIAGGSMKAASRTSTATPRSSARPTGRRRRPSRRPTAAVTTW